MDLRYGGRLYFSVIAPHRFASVANVHNISLEISGIWGHITMWVIALCFGGLMWGGEGKWICGPFLIRVQLKYPVSFHFHLIVACMFQSSAFHVSALPCNSVCYPCCKASLAARIPLFTSVAISITTSDLIAVCIKCVSIKSPPGFCIFGSLYAAFAPPRRLLQSAKLASANIGLCMLCKAHYK